MLALVHNLTLMVNYMVELKLNKGYKSNEYKVSDESINVTGTGDYE